MTSKNIGDFGENAACEYLENLGFEIVKRNFKLRTGEIDIIADDDGCTVFVEVKTRSNNFFGEPSEYVNAQKIKHIKETAMLYSASLDVDMRFDVIEIIYGIENGKLTVRKLNHIRNAF